MQHIWYSDALWGLPPRAIHFWHAMLCKRGLCRHTVPVRPSVRLSRLCILSKWINISTNICHHQIATPFWFFLHGNIPTGTPLIGALNACGVGRNRDSEPISGFIVCHQCCDWLCVINTVPPDRGKLWHLSLVVSGGVCWWRETMAKCLWPEVSTLRQRHRNSLQWFNL